MEKNGEYKKSDRWINFMGNELRIMGKVEGYYVLRYKGFAPFVKSIKEFPKFLQFIDAKKQSK